jgi:mono/diheme cytochrome c family protein
MKSTSRLSRALRALRSLSDVANKRRHAVASLACGALVAGLVMSVVLPRAPHVLLIKEARAAEATPAATPATPATTPDANADTRPDIVKRGEYLARAGDCVACHTAPRGKLCAGGLAMETPFGTLYSPNITPDAQYGIGTWSEEAFFKMMRTGLAQDGRLLYPAMPIAQYTKVTREDSNAIFAYLKSVQPVREPNHKHTLRFPFNQRKLLYGWRTLYFREGEFQPDPTRSVEWNRGAYLVEGLGHCTMCHTKINMLGGSSQSEQFAGGLIPVQNWYAPSLVSSKETGIGKWDIKEIVDLLRTGVSAQGAVYGPMAAVVQHSLQETNLTDLTAMATYLKARAQTAAAPEVTQVEPTTEQTKAMMESGAKLYEKHCSDCHQPDGNGVPRVYPPLATNSSILMRYPVNAIRIVLNGGFPPSTEGNPRPYGMPPFYQELNDDEVAAVVTYVRRTWGNVAPPVSPAEVVKARGVPTD